MTDHPAISTLLALAATPDRLSFEEAGAVVLAAEALKTLQALRPHTPDAVVGRRYAHMFVDHGALLDAQRIVGDHQLPRFDIEAARLAHTQDRAAHYQGMDRSDVKAKWGCR